MKRSFYVAIVEQTWLNLLERERAELLCILSTGFMTEREWNDYYILALTVDLEEEAAEARNKFRAFCSKLISKCGREVIYKTLERTGDYEFQS